MHTTSPLRRTFPGRRSAPIAAAALVLALAGGAQAAPDAGAATAVEFAARSPQREIGPAGSLGAEPNRAAPVRDFPHLPELPPVEVKIPLNRALEAAIERGLDSETGAGAKLGLADAEREALRAFYALGGFKPLWITADLSAGLAPASWTTAAKQVIVRLAAAAEEGLEPSAYATPVLAADRRGSIDALAHAELQFSAAAVRYARDARGARISPRRLDKNITPVLDLPAADHVLTDLAAAQDAGAALAAYNPPHAGYRALRAKLAELRGSGPAQPMVEVPPGPSLRVGMSDERVPLIRARFGLEGAEGERSRVYDQRVASAVAEFQRRRGIEADGIFGRQTLAALDRSPRRTEADLVANMERWRWLPTRLGERHVVVNVPEYKMRLVSGGEILHDARVIVGKAQTPTPIFSDSIKHLIVNPYWTIPPSILRNEVLPGLAADPDYAAKRGYEVIRHNGTISVRQPPGEANALGLIKFMFPNEHHVYLHDTPNRRLFATANRAYSHGCVRVEDPFRLGELLLERDGWSQERLRALVGRGERLVRLSQPIPVHLTYFTLTVDGSGQLRSFEDLYGFDAKVREALGLRG